MFPCDCFAHLKYSEAKNKTICRVISEAHNDTPNEDHFCIPDVLIYVEEVEKEEESASRGEKEVSPTSPPREILLIQTKQKSG